MRRIGNEVFSIGLGRAADSQEVKKIGRAEKHKKKNKGGK